MGQFKQVICPQSSDGFLLIAGEKQEYGGEICQGPSDESF